MLRQRIWVWVVLSLLGWSSSAGAITELRPPDLEKGSAFGVPVAAFFQYAAVSAMHADDKSGAVFLYRNDSQTGETELVARLQSPSRAPGALFGQGLSVGVADGPEAMILVGEPGAANKTPGGAEEISGTGAAHIWVVGPDGVEFVQTLRPPSEDVRGMGAVVRACGPWLFVTANKGVMVYEAAEEGFRFHALLERTSEEFGASLACGLAGTLAVGAPKHRKKDSYGAVFLYAYRDGDWVQSQKLLAPNAGEFGRSVELGLLNNVLVVGAYQEDRPRDVYPDYQNALGAAYIYESGDPESPDAKWSLVDRVHGPNTKHDDHFGVSVAIGGDVIFVGAFNQAKSPTASGMLHTWTRGADRWLHGAAIRPQGEEPYEAFGISTAAGHQFVVVGASFYAGETNPPGNAFLLTASEALNGVLEGSKSVENAPDSAAGEPPPTTGTAAAPPDPHADDDVGDDTSDDAEKRRRQRERDRKADRLTKSMGELGTSSSYDSLDICLAFGILLLLVGFAAYRRMVRF